MDTNLLTIRAVAPGSPAAEAGVAPGSTLVSLNGRPVVDALGLRFAETAGQVDLVWRDAEGRERRAVIEKSDDVPLGLGVDPLTMRACNNRCAFCFAHQNARGMRRSLYFKDDDYRFSFLNGTFATLTLLPLEELVQIGATVAVGVLLDTFVVRALLIPAITYRLGERTWWVPRWLQRRPPADAERASA